MGRVGGGPEPGRSCRRRARLAVLMHWACRLWPRDFRERLADDMAASFAREVERLRVRRGRLAAARYAVRTLLGTLIGSLPAHSAAPSPAPRREVIMDNFAKELRYALRTLARHRGLTAATVLTIGLGIGATTTMFGIVDAVLIEPLPYREPDALVAVWEHNLRGNDDRNVVSPANFLTWRQEADALQGLSAVVGTSGTVTGDGEPERVGMVLASASIFPLLGARTAAGRVYTPEEDGEGAAGPEDSDAPSGAAGDNVAPAGPVPAVLGHGFWQRRYGGDPEVVGRSITLNGREVVVVGVLSREFRFEPAAGFNYTGTEDVWLPHRFPPEAREATGRYLQVIARLRPGATVEGAEAQLKTIAARLAEERPRAMEGWSVNVMPLRQQVVGDVSTPLLVVLGAVGMVLLIACANVANLLLVQSTGRTRELAVRAALGAGRGRLLRQLLGESLVLAVGGGLLGVSLAFAGVRAVVLLGPDIPRLGEIAVDGGVLAFASAVTLLTGLLFGLAPAVRAAGVDPVSGLREGGGRSGTGRGVQRARAALVVGEIALSLVLLAGAGLLVRSFWNLMDRDLGFDTDPVLAADVQLPPREYPEEAQRARLFDDLVERVRALPGVEEASAITWAPLTGPGTRTSFWPDDRPVPEPSAMPSASIHWVDERYFRTMKIPLIAGRTFDARDDEEAPLEVVVNRTLAEELWPDQSPIGETISMPWGDVRVGEIVGVVGDVRRDGPATEPRSTIYWHQRQFMGFDFMTLVLRTTNDPKGLTPALRAAVRELDPNLPVYRVRTMQQYLDETVATTRFAMLALGTFALLAVVLAGVGIYGVVAYTFRQRSHEMGIRAALGAARADIVRLVLRSALGLLALGLGIGVVGALLLTRLMQGMIFGVEPGDPLTLAAVSGLLALATLLATYVPARRASRADVTVVLREA